MAKENMVKDGTYILIQSFMVKDLNLKGNELLIYAIIFGFSQDGVNKFEGSLQYLANWTGTSKTSVQTNLKALIDKGYIEKEEKYINNIKFVSYYAKNLHSIQKSCIPYKKVNGGIQENCIGGMQKSCTNIIDNNNIDNNINNNNNYNYNNKDNNTIINNKYNNNTSNNIYSNNNNNNDNNSNVNERQELVKVVNDLVKDEELKDLIVEFIKMRKLMKKPLTEFALKRCINKLSKLSVNISKQKEIVIQSITNGWLDFYELKSTQTKTKNDSFSDYYQFSEEF